jgi:hypothetical protein
MSIKLGISHRFFRHRVLRKAFKPNNKKVTRDWMRPHNGGGALTVITTCQISGNQEKEGKMDGSCGTHREDRVWRQKPEELGHL